MWSWNAPSGPPASSSCALGLVVHYASVALHYWSFWWNYTFSLWISAMPSYLQGMFFSSLFPKRFLYSYFKKTCSISLLTFLSPSRLEELFDASIWPCRYSIKAFLSLHYKFVHSPLDGEFLEKRSHVLFISVSPASDTGQSKCSLNACSMNE